MRSVQPEVGSPFTRTQLFLYDLPRKWVSAADHERQAMDSYDCQITDSLTLDKILASKAESHISIDVKSAIVLGTLCCTSVVMTCPPVWLGGRNGRRASVLQARLSSLATSSTLLDGASLFDLTILHIATTTHVSHKLNYPSI